ADPKAPGAIQAAGLVNDPDALVRLAALLALADAPSSPEAAQAVVAALAEGKVEGDRWLPDAATSAAAQHAGPFLKALAARKFAKAPSTTTLTIANRVAEHYARSIPSGSSVDVLIGLEDADKGVTDAVIAGLAAG